jgi:hypothetical protein
MDRDPASNSLLNSSVIKLKGKSNYNEWKFVISLLIKNEKYGKKTKQGQIDSALELRLQTIIALHVSEPVLGNISHCTSHDEMLDTLDNLYGNREHDLNQLYTNFQNYKYLNDLSAHENVNKLQSFKVNIEKLGDQISETAFKTKILNILPKRFSSFVSACNLQPKISLEQLMQGLAAEDGRLTHIRNEKLDSKLTNSSTLTEACYICSKTGHQAKNCYSRTKVSNESCMATANSKHDRESSKKPNEKKDDPCRYCKEVGHFVNNCPDLEKRKNATCHNCKDKGHYAKNCPKKNFSTAQNSSSSSFIACMNVNLSNASNIIRESWILDNACTAHVSNDASNFTTLTAAESGLVVGNGEIVNVEKQGSIYASHNGVNLVFKDVLFNKNSPANLISFVALLRNGWRVVEYEITRIVLCKDSFQITATLDDNNLWIVPIEIIRKPEKVSNLNYACLSLNEWHRKFAHQNLDYIRDLLKQNRIQYQEVRKDFKCVNCLTGKAVRQPFAVSTFKANEVGELTHSDLLTAPKSYSNHCIILSNAI